MAGKINYYFKLYRFIINIIIIVIIIVKSLWQQPNFKPKLPNKYLSVNKLAYQIHINHAKTFYCDCSYQDKIIDLSSCGYKVNNNFKRASSLEWEHIVPVSILAQNFACWQQPICCDGQHCYKGRSCCEKIDNTYRRMAADLHNLVPEIGELNGLRGNYSFSELPHIDFKQFGSCRFKIDHKLRQVEAYGYKKGIIARAYLYMAKRYTINLEPSAQNLYLNWNKQYPPTKWEITWNNQVNFVQGTDNEFISKYNN